MIVTKYIEIQCLYHGLHFKCINSVVGLHFSSEIRGFYQCTEDTTNVRTSVRITMWSLNTCFEPPIQNDIAIATEWLGERVTYHW